MTVTVAPGCQGGAVTVTFSFEVSRSLAALTTEAFVVSDGVGGVAADGGLTGTASEPRPTA